MHNPHLRPRRRRLGRPGAAPRPAGKRQAGPERACTGAHSPRQENGSCGPEGGPQVDDAGGADGGGALGGGALGGGGRSGGGEAGSFPPGQPVPQLVQSGYATFDPKLALHVLSTVPSAMPTCNSGHA